MRWKILVWVGGWMGKRKGKGLWICLGGMVAVGGNDGDEYFFFFGVMPFYVYSFFLNHSVVFYSREYRLFQTLPLFIQLLHQWCITAAPLPQSAQRNGQHTVRRPHLRLPRVQKKSKWLFIDNSGIEIRFNLPATSSSKARDNWERKDKGRGSLIQSQSFDFPENVSEIPAPFVHESGAKSCTEFK